MRTAHSYLIHEQLIRRIQDRREALGSFQTLAEEIMRCAGRHSKPLDRRKLKRIADGDATVLISFEELNALDRWLRSCFKEGLGDCLKRSLMDDVVRMNRVSVLVGSKAFQSYPDLHKISVTSHWDLRAATEHVLPSLHREAPSQGVSVRLHEVLNSVPYFGPGDQEDEPGDVSAFQERVMKEDWAQLLNESGSIIAIGSPKANAAQEILLGRIFNAAPFRDSAEADRRRLPFRMIWSQAYLDRWPSTFAVGVPPRSDADWASQGLRFLDKDYWVDRDQKAWNTYGLIVGAKRSHDQIMIGLFGASGPATLACAKVLAGRNLNCLPNPYMGEHKVVCWLIEGKTVIEEGKTHQGDNRVLLEDEIKIIAEYEHVLV